MSQEQQYDIVVIGSGPSGREVSLHSVKYGFSVALIESNLVGGDCAYYACIPSKALLRPPEALTEARQVEGARQAAVGSLSVESVFARRDAFVDHWDDANLTNMMEEGGVHILRGHGRLDGHKRVVVTSADGDSSSAISTPLVARHAVVLSTGSSPDIPMCPDCWRQSHGPAAMPLAPRKFLNGLS
jgi:pyruvate/2-oxoglutarate dehydrogenase complex dihydrolipoamide dehydrogenase (E3) component